MNCRQKPQLRLKHSENYLNFSRRAIDLEKISHNNFQMSATRRFTFFVTASMIALFFSPISAHSAINGYPECSSNQVGTLRGPTGKTEVCIGINGGKGVWVKGTSVSHHENFNPGNSNSGGGQNNNSSQPFVMKTGPACTSTTPFTAAPMDLSTATFSPLGNVNPPGHITPSGHGGFGPPASKAADGRGPFGNGLIPGVTTLYSPVKIASISELRLSTVTDSTGKVTRDFSILFNICGPLYGEIGHFSQVNTKIENALKNAKPEQECQDYSQKNGVGGEGAKSIFCIYATVPASIAAGEKLGMTGDAFGVDFGVIDITKPHKAASFSIYPPQGDETYSICPLNLFTPALKAKINAPAGCGQSTYDTAGTALGAWFSDDSQQSYQQGKMISLVPTVAVQVDGSNQIDKQFSLVTGISVPSTLQQATIYKLSVDPATIKIGKLVCVNVSVSHGPQQSADIQLGISVGAKGNFETLTLSDCSGKGAYVYQRSKKYGP